MVYEEEEKINWGNFWSLEKLLLKSYKVRD
jgi:hypothetical protein